MQKVIQNGAQNLAKWGKMWWKWWDLVKFHKSEAKMMRNDDDACDDDEIEHKSVIKCDKMMQWCDKMW